MKKKEKVVEEEEEMNEDEDGGMNMGETLEGGCICRGGGIDG